MEALSQALLATRQLRASVAQVFEVLVNGIVAGEEEENAPVTNSSNIPSAPTSTASAATPATASAATNSGGKDGNARFLQDFQEHFNMVNMNLRELESIINGIPTPPVPFNLGNTTFLAQEITQERQALYAQLVNSYKWIDKIHDYSFLANNLLNCNSLRRSYISSSNKRSRLPISSCNTASSQHLDKLLTEINLNSVHTNYKICRPFGANAVVIMNIGRVLKAAVVFKGVMIEWVTVKAFDEQLDADDLWSESRYLVFRKVQEQTHSAMLHFFSPTLPDLAVKSYMTWIHSYSKLFVEPCRRCGKHLQNSLPPTWRDLRTLEPFHEECRNC